MISTDELSFLLRALYSAPLEPGMWQVFLDRLCELTNVACGYLVGAYPGDVSVVLAGGGMNFDPEVFHLYSEHFGSCDVYKPPLLAKPRTGLIDGDELVDRAVLLESELYNDLLRRFDLESTNLLMCQCSHEQLEGLSLWRSPKVGAMDAASANLLETLLPHLQTALRLRTKIVAGQASHTFSEAALDAMSIAAFLVDGRGRIRHMNRLAAELLREGSALCSRQGGLTASDSREAAELDRLLAGAVLNGADAAPGGAMIVSRTTDGARLQVTVVPVPEQNLLTQSESAVVFVNDSTAVPESRAAALGALYRLTPTECRIADLLLEGLEVKEVAGRMAITVETARFHLKRVFAKTGARRQTELMRLMLCLPGMP